MLLGGDLSAEPQRRLLLEDIAVEVTLLLWMLCPIVGAAGTAEAGALAWDLALFFCFETRRTFLMFGKITLSDMEVVSASSMMSWFACWTFSLLFESGETSRPDMADSKLLTLPLPCENLQFSLHVHLF